jgi:hypothetical protein
MVRRRPQTVGTSARRRAAGYARSADRRRREELRCRSALGACRPRVVIGPLREQGRRSRRVIRRHRSVARSRVSCPAPAPPPYPPPSAGWGCSGRMRALARRVCQTPNLLERRDPQVPQRHIRAGGSDLDGWGNRSIVVTPRKRSAHRSTVRYVFDRTGMQPAGSADRRFSAGRRVFVGRRYVRRLHTRPSIGAVVPRTIDSGASGRSNGVPRATALASCHGCV